MKKNNFLSVGLRQASVGHRRLTKKRRSDALSKDKGRPTEHFLSDESHFRRRRKKKEKWKEVGTGEVMFREEMNGRKLKGLEES